LKKVWAASITILFTVSVLVFSSQAAYAGQEPEMVLKCYGGDFKVPKNPDFDPVTFEDMLQTAVATPNEEQRVCVQALKHSTLPPLDPILWWVEFEDDVSPPGTFPDVKLTDQILGTKTGTLFHFEFAMSAEVNNNVVIIGDINHPLSGYGVGFDVPPPDPLPAVPITVTDQFGTSIITPQSFFSYLTPTIVDGTGTLVGMDFACYMYDSEEEIPKFPGVTFNPAYTVKTIMGTRILDGLSQPDVLCVKAEKMLPTPPPPTTPKVGGEFLPIETTSLLLAAASNPASWLTSLTIAALAIGAYVFTRNPNNMRNIKVILRDYLDRL